MLAIYIATVLALLGSDILPSKVHAGREKSGGSGDSKGSKDSKGSINSRDDDKTYCKKADPYRQAVENKIDYLKGKKQPLPKCTSGASGTISKIDICDANSGKTTSLLTCSNCTGPHVPVKDTAECCNVADVFRPALDQLCKIVTPRCKSFMVYRCASPTVSTTEARTTVVLPTTRSTAAPGTAPSSASPATISASQSPTTTSTALPATISVTQQPTTTQSSPAPITRSPTPFRDPGYYSYLSTYVTS